MKIKSITAFLAIAIMTFAVDAENNLPSDSSRFTISYKTNTEVNVGSGEFAPYYISSNRYGTLTQPISVSERASIYKPLDSEQRFSYAFGADAIAMYSKPTDYLRFNTDINSLEKNSQRPAPVWLQQLWGEVKWRGMFLLIGMKENDRSIFDNSLSSGDITLSNNARPVPQIRIGFIDFQNIPFTNGWVQIQGEVAYGKFLDSNWLKNHYNRYNSFVTTSTWMHYKRCYFRTKPDERFSLTVGLQHASQFGGYTDRFYDGKLVSHTGEKVKFKDFLNVFVQRQGKNDGIAAGDEAYYVGNHLGSWDLQLRYRFNNFNLTAYMQSPWEDGSGIGKLNGWDGVWGLRYESLQTGIISSAVVEYFDFTNQSGPIHWAPGDHANTQVPGQATGADDYYNNFAYNGWSYYGMSLGSPLMKSTIYNTDGYLHYTDNRIRGFHIGVEGNILGNVDYRLLAGWRMSLGTPFIPTAKQLNNTSMMIEGSYKFPKISGLKIIGQVAFDAGNLYGNNFGILATLGYSGKLSF